MAGLLLLVALSSIAGCATRAPIPRERRLAVLEIEPSVGDRALRRVLHERHATVTPEILERDRQHINATLTAALTDGGQCGTSLDIVAGTDFPGAADLSHSPDPATLAMLEASHPADVYLRLRVTDYGETPRRWEGAYVTFEVVSTLGIAAALYAHKVTRAVAGAYLIEESVEELSEGYAGFWALNRLSRPVRIEADLIDGKTGAILGSETHVGLARWRWGHLWHMDAATRDQLLDTSMHKAVKPLEAFCQAAPGSRPGQ